jgi:hypothetical protein
MNNTNEMLITIYPITELYTNYNGKNDIDSNKFNNILKNMQVKFPTLSSKKYKLFTYRDFEMKVIDNVKYLEQNTQLESYVNNNYLVTVSSHKSNLDTNSFPMLNKYFTDLLREHFICNISDKITINLIKDFTNKNYKYYIYLSVCTNDTNVQYDELILTLQKYMST